MGLVFLPASLLAFTRTLFTKVKLEPSENLAVGDKTKPLVCLWLTILPHSHLALLLSLV